MADSYFLGSNVELKHVGGTVYEASGALVLFGEGMKSADFVGDWFAPDTDYDLNPDGTGEATVYYNHGVDGVIRKNRLGNQKAQLSKDERAVWIKQQLDVANTYDAMVVELLQKRQAIGKNFGWSSGGVSHLVEREPQADRSNKITKWPLSADASITLIPADWRQTLIPVAELKPTNIKSLLETVSDSGEQTEGHRPEAQTAEDAEASQGADTTQVGETADEQTSNSSINQQMEVIVMSDTPNQTPDGDENKALSALKTQFDQKMQAVDDKMDKILKAMENAPRDQIGGYYTVDGGSADPEIKTIGDLALAVARKDDKRLREVYKAIPAEQLMDAKSQNTLELSAGGVMVQPEILTGLGLDLSLLSPLDELVFSIPVTAPYGGLPMPNYKVTPSSDGQSASAGGVKGSKRKEGGSYIATELELEEVKFDVSDFASGHLKATRMQMKAAPTIEALLINAIREAVGNRKEWAILGGSGNGEPLGVLNWAGKIEVTEDTQDAFVAADLDEMISRLYVKDGSKVAWMYSYNAYTKVAPLARGETAVVGNRGSAPMNVLNGYPHHRTQHLPAVGTDGYIVVGDWSCYLSFEYDGLYIDYSDQRYIDEGKVAWFFGQWLDGKPILPTSITLEDGTSSISPFVVIKRA